MHQQIDIIGNLGRDPDNKFTPSGQAVCGFAVAANRSWTGKDGERMKETIWFRVEAWGKLAEVCGKYLQSGSLVRVIGRMKPPRPYQKKDGTWDCQLEVVAAEVLFLGKTRTAESEQSAQTESEQSAQTESEQSAQTESEIPF